MPRLRTAVLALLLTALTACSAIPSTSQSQRPLPTASTEAPAPTDATGANTTGKDSGLPNACDLLTTAEAEAVADTELQNPEDAAGVQCLFAGPVDGPTAQVEVFVGPGAKKFYDIDVELGHEFTPLPGIGDEAHAEEDTVFGRVGDTWFAVRLVRLNDPAENAPRLVTAAKAVAARMA
ncbi:hypothetical protein [Umezawaea sp. NPDC059074]|uniref:hypothetical protein n=1 Tax=Umezawaea sp. NPDC059074 TaxID=3346716 RepID=UPI0036B697FC